MNYRTLGRTGVQVSALCLGSMEFGGKTPEDDALRVVDRALDAGINFIDTANVYGRGVSEEIVGRALERDGKRKGVVLATKVNVKMRDGDPNASGNHRRHIMEQAHESLRRLKTDTIDLYYIHRPQSDVPIDETLRALDDLIHQGKVQYIACSTFAAWSVLEALWVSDRLRLNRFVAEQPPYHLLERSVERELIPLAQTYDLGIMPWSPLAGGLLTGKYTRGNVVEGGRLQPGNAWGDKHFTPAAFEALDGLAALAKEKSCSMTQLALGWLLHMPAVTSPVLGPRSVAQLDEQLGAVDVKLTPEDLKRIDSISPPGSALVPYYYTDGFADFRPHPRRW
ncbi:aldo/keto reductase [Sorangium sp. So ce388]|uniref:aldo/keto reductase n=1 Tax=Sorangium sp. So ce388 TaxID=3133309 RepID=UPI003F5C44BA